MNQSLGACLNKMPYADSPKIKSLYITFELIIAVLAIIGNFLVCLSITRTKKLRTITNYFLVSLAVADMLVGLVAIPCAVLTDVGRPHRDLPLCLLIISVLMILTQSSILSLLAVAAERYMAILLPFQYQRLMNPRAACVTLLLTWSLAVLSGCVPVIDWQKQPENSMYCIFTCMVRMSFMVYCNFFCFLLIPLIAMFIIYARIFLIVRGQLRRIPQVRTNTFCTGQEDTGNMEATEMQKAISIFLLLFLFTVCWMPINLINCVLFFCPTCDVPMYIILVAILLSHANSALNPLLYAYRMRSFRRALMEMWKVV
ncbi:adenosine receptor A1-like [Eucyclogobius newberryi]|uniref:adenosine receptor A1-like n=1 Tax=Eucyclogobius newberryi TaxID=166745 RepID=UPI003B59796F